MFPVASRAVDLTALQKKLARTGQMSELEFKIRRALHTQSCLTDMREAGWTFDALQKLLRSVRGWRSPEREATEAALQATAAMLYARATVTQSSRRPSGEPPERGPIQIDAELAPDQLVDHRAIVDVRSQGLAHVYIDRDIAGVTYHTAAVLLIRDEDGWTPSVASKRVVLSRPLIGHLGRAIPVALSILEARANDRLSEVAVAISDQQGRQFDILLSDCWLDEVGFFGSEEAAEQALGDVQRGRSHIFIQ